MRFPNESYQMQQVIAQRFPDLRPSQQRGLALWVYGTILAYSGTQSAVATALASTMGAFNSVRQHLREWLHDGADRAAPCNTQLEVGLCFAPLMRWLLSLWQTDHLALAIDATLRGDKVAAVVVSVLYRGSAIPVGWHIARANQKGPWIPSVLRVLRLLGPAIPKTMKVLVMTDRGLWSPRIWKQIQALGWHPLMRVKNNTVFQPLNGCRKPARTLIPGPGHGWVGTGTAFRSKDVRRFGTLIVVWEREKSEPWIVLTDLPPEEVDVSWYGLRMWIELGFRALKGVGWQWNQTRRTDPQRVARHWLVLSVATLWVMAYGTRAEDAANLGLTPDRMRAPRVDIHCQRSDSGRRDRLTSVFRQGISCLIRQLHKARMWRRLWLLPEPWPTASPHLQVACHPSPAIAQFHQYIPQ